MATQPIPMQRLDAWIRRWADGVVAHRGWVIALTLALVVAAGAGIPGLGLTNDYRYFFSRKNPQLIEFERSQRIFNKNDNLLLVLAPADGAVFAPEALAAVQRLTERAWQVPYAVRVDSVTNFQHTAAQGDDLRVADLVADPERLSETDLAKIRQIALGEPELARRLISEGAHVTGVNITLEMPGKDNREQARAVQFARAISREVEAEFPGTRVYLTGIVALSNALAECAMTDMQTLVPLMYAGMVIVMLLLTRSLSGTLTTVGVIGLSTVTAMGLTGWTPILITPVSAMAPTMIMTLAVANCVHLLEGVFYARRQGAAVGEAISRSVRLNLPPIFVTALTTVIGFLSLNFSDAPPFRDLGNMTAAGVAAAFCLSVGFFPAVLSFFALPPRSTGRPLDRLLAKFAELVLRRQAPIFWIGLMALFGAVLLLPQNDLNDQYVRYFEPEVAFRTDTDFISKNLTGIYQIDYPLPAGGAGDICDPAYLAMLDAFTTWWQARPDVIHVSSVSDTIKKLNMNMHGDDPAYYALPEDRELIAQYLLLYEMSLPYGLDLNNRINVDKSATRLTVTLDDVTSNRLRESARAGEAWLATHAPTSRVRGVGSSVMFANISHRNIKSMLVGTTVALVLISLTLILALRSVRYGLLSLVPNLIPSAMAFGIWGLAVGEVNVGLSVVTAMTLGIVVDDTVHFLSKYLRARREEEMGVKGAIRYAMAAVGPAMIGTSLILFAGFFILSLSSFNLNGSMGRLTGITILLALAADLTFLPALLVRVGHKESVRRAHLEPQAKVA